jgi:hypothetical protein
MMKIKLIFLAILLISGQSFFAQNLPVIRATSPSVDIRDGAIMSAGVWKISPETRPDIYRTTSKGKKVTFYTDIDSISFLVKPGGKYDFVILLNGKDSAFTEIIYEPGALESTKYAEDNWGNRINLGDSIRTKTTVIVPISTSNCGYCLIDGYFVEKNYMEANSSNGGACFHQCLFNPQLDIYAFEKHFKWDKPVLTFPPSLHKLHENGFPTVLAFKDGQQVLKIYNNYDDYSDLRKLLWTGTHAMTPTGNMHMAERLFYENEKLDGVMVFPAGKHISKEVIESGIKWKAYNCKNIDSLTTEDLQKYLTFMGRFTSKDMSGFFQQKEIPFRFSGENIEAGEYSFPFDSVGIFAWFVNPFNPEKYVILRISNGQRSFKQTNYLDFVIFSGKDSLRSKQLLYGQYRQEGTKLSVVPEKTFSDVVLQDYCKTYCKIPVPKVYHDHADRYRELTTTRTVNDFGTTWTIGNGDCRFPHIIDDGNKNTYVVHEESGDIILTRISNEKATHFFIETNETDSYNPVAAFDGQRVWVFYLNNKDDYYRVYARFLENNILSDELLISDKGPFDVSTLNVASKNAEISVIWSEWKANMRYLRMRKIIQGAMQESTPVLLASPKYIDEYSNAWYPSLCYSENGELWGAWNQHYPGLFCVIGGKINEAPQPVTLTADKMDDWEMGGYPCIFANRDNKKFIVYESSGWDTYNKNTAQQIKISAFNEELKKWSVASVLSDGRQTFLNQTPVAVCDEKSNMIVCWSGRPVEEHSNWGIYIAMNISGKWTKPVCISKPGMPSRHPRIFYDKKAKEIWVSWHAGTGSEMKTEVLRIKEKVLM